MHERTKRQWLLAVIVTSLLPPLFLVSFPSLVTLETVLLYASAIVGYWGIVLLLWQYALGARQITGLFFKDLAPVLSIHKWLGKYGSLVIFLHPFLVLYFYGESLIYPFLPLVSNEMERAITLGRISFFLMVAVWLTSALVRDAIRFRPWKYIHYLAYISLPFALLHIPNLGSQYMSHTSVQVYFMGLLIVYILVTLIRIRGWLQLDGAVYEIVKHIELGKQDMLITLRPSTSRVLIPKQGQYVYLRFGMLSESHPFSILEHATASNELTIAYRKYGMFTTTLSRLKTGSRIRVDGPYGTFMSTLEPVTPVVYISGGIGITPFVGQIKADAGTRDQWLFAASRTPESAPLIPWLRTILGERCMAVYSRSASTKPNEINGHIDARLLERFLDSPARYSFYICGPRDMIRDMYTLLTTMKVPASHIHSELFSW